MSAGSRRATPTPTDEIAPLTTPPAGPDSAAIGGDELRARAYLRAAIGETDWWSRHPAAPAPQDTPPTPYAEIHHHHHYYEAQPETPAPVRERMLDFSRYTADKPRLVAVAAGIAVQPFWYHLAAEAGTGVPIGLTFMAGLFTGYWRVCYPNPITRRLFAFNVAAGVFYLPTFALITTILTGVH